MMQITKRERLELDALSKDVFGASSRWHKLVERGYEELVTEEIEETIPAQKEGEEPTKQKVRVPVLKNGGRQLVQKYHTVESVRVFMQEQKKQLDELRAQIKKHQDELLAKKKEEESKKLAEQQALAVHERLGGSAK